MFLINLIGAPGAGKSTMAAGLFHTLKKNGWNVEMITEYTKELILTNNRHVLSDELLVFAEKYRRIKQMENVDIVITDSPLLNSVVYGKMQFGEEGESFFLKAAERFDSAYYVIERRVPYIPLGRMPDAEGAHKVGLELVNYLNITQTPWTSIPGDDEGLVDLISNVEWEAKKRGIQPLTENTTYQQTKEGSEHYAPGLDTPKHLV